MIHRAAKYIYTINNKYININIFCGLWYLKNKYNYVEYCSNTYKWKFYLKENVKKKSPTESPIPNKTMIYYPRTICEKYHHFSQIYSNYYLCTI